MSRQSVTFLKENNYTEVKNALATESGEKIAKKCATRLMAGDVIEVCPRDNVIHFSRSGKNVGVVDTLGCTFISEGSKHPIPSFSIAPQAQHLFGEKQQAKWLVELICAAVGLGLVEEDSAEEGVFRYRLESLAEAIDIEAKWLEKETRRKLAEHIQHHAAH